MRAWRSCSRGRDKASEKTMLPDLGPSLPPPNGAEKAAQSREGFLIFHFDPARTPYRIGLTNEIEPLPDLSETKWHWQIRVCERSAQTSLEIYQSISNRDFERRCAHFRQPIRFPDIRRID